MSLLKRHDGAFLVLLAIAAPLTFAFCWHTVVSSLGDDSVSYLALARHFSPFAADPFIAPWAKYHGHFPPLFPLLLVFTGGASSFLAAHLAVGACALAALVFVYRYATLRLESAAAGLLATLLFLLSPSAWINILGILSEPLYLAVSLAAIVFHERRVEAGGGKASLFLFGVLLAGAYLTRAAGIALIAAYAAHVAVRAIASRSLPRPAAMAPFIVPVAATLLWLWLRPAPDVDNYRLTLRLVIDRWANDPDTLHASWDALLGGWVASFSGDSEVGLAMRVAFGALAILGVAGAVLGARRNRLDSWYVLASLAMLFVWVFPEPIARRLLYPLLPLLIVHAAEVVRAACASLQGRPRLLVLLAAWALPAIMMLPATLLVAQKALAREPIIEGSAYSLASVTDYYTTVNVSRARALAAEHAAVLAGLGAIDRATPRGARVMWMRPEYVAVLGRRDAVAWYLTWDIPTLAREIRRSGAGYLVAARLYKNDLAGRTGVGFPPLATSPPAYLRPALVIANPADGATAFVLLEVDREALDRYLAAGA